MWCGPPWINPAGGTLSAGDLRGRIFFGETGCIELKFAPSEKWRDGCVLPTKEGRRAWVLYLYLKRAPHPSGFEKLEVVNNISLSSSRAEAF